MEGEWQGMAVTTPVGEVKYNIEFSVDENGLTGIADTGSSFHHWQFMLFYIVNSNKILNILKLVT